MNEKIKIRCSAIGKIMTEPRLKSDKESGLLGETAKTFIREIWLNNNFGYRDEVVTDPMLKGHICEQDSMALVQKVLGGQFRVKSDINLENEYITGHCDIDQDKEDCVEDIKTSWDIRTFYESEMTKDNEFQLRGYCGILKRSKGRIIYCLVDSPTEIIVELQKRVWFKFGCDDQNPDYQRISQQIKLNHTPSLIPLDILPLAKRIKVFELTRDIEIENKIYGQVEKARIYYESLTI